MNVQYIYAYLIRLRLQPFLILPSVILIRLANSKDLNWVFYILLVQWLKCQFTKLH
ncbi:hypothetical protein VCRA2122O12_330047 [Vibrio crassostreae]|nr:hypothetical protein VCRA2117O328_270053 [Vibrio crassostreae]CAK1996051.1 hypothetical protein VCRA2114E5_300005 [Vibrio crassostreae]CAK1998343.1 hypothetical protein VCRA2110O4_320005 [Vibrio crassostreae]CAK2009029.1 hypothetical protein VCRA2110O1_330047 [Vibrio crassostreae]CAK2311592.1 hypothetical protein VCRA2110O318_280005 [Vibrio crassostreae]